MKSISRWRKNRRDRDARSNHQLEKGNNSWVYLPVANSHLIEGLAKGTWTVVSVYQSVEKRKIERTWV